jgi:hypothetical protein
MIRLTALWALQHFIVFDELWMMPSWHTLKWGRSCELLLDDEVGDIRTDSPAPQLQGKEQMHASGSF